MISEKIIPLLTNVRQTGPGQWISCCPVHDDKTPSFAVRETIGKSGEPTLMMHCFACQASIDEICGALGLTISDLYPQKHIETGDQKYQRKYFPAADVLTCVHNDALMTKVFARRMTNGELLNEKEMKYLQAIEQRLGVACEYAR